MCISLPDGRTGIGPWLLLDTYGEVLAILSWSNASAEEKADHENSIRRWSVSSIGLHPAARQLAS